ncbi:PREDICTED: uncharacterized protein LOC108663635 [Theobroma cacao]|uniref:Uncharacterized protein LOC108663635 n=1 Tax=Theobroma cacao TaxID=3641 RepID=A0AB32X0S9_THECC|nr:PREDICTED: uncharacterized protein LOC108663635 [Theobroma cacao]
MLKLKDLDNLDDGGLWEKLKKESEVGTHDESQRQNKLYVMVLLGFIDYCARKKKKMIVEKKGIKRRFRTGFGSKSPSVEEENEDYWIREQKKQKTSDGKKQKPGSGKKQKQKHKTGSEKKQNQRKGTDPFTELTALGLEPPPDMPQAFKNRIENLGGTDIKLVTQKFIKPTDLNPGHNRLSMTLKQVRSKFLSEAEDEKLKNNQGMDVILVEPCLEVSRVHLTKWLIGGSFAYVFKTQWNQIVRNNADTLKPEAVVQIWSFRVGPESQLGFAMIKVKDAKEVSEIN